LSNAGDHAKVAEGRQSSIRVDRMALAQWAGTTPGGCLTSDLSLLVAEARGAHRLSDAIDGFGAIEANAAFGVIEPSVIVLLDSALEKFFESDALADRIVVLVPPALAPEDDRRKDPPTRSFLASREVFQKARLADFPPEDWCYRALQWAVAGPQLAARVDVVHKPPAAALAARPGSCEAVLSHRGPERYLRVCVDSLLRQSQPTRVTIGVDQKYNCRRLLAETADNPAVSAYQVGPPPLGPFVALHVLSHVAQADFVLRQDSDDVSLRHRLRTLIATAEAAGAGVVGSHEIQLHEIERKVVPVRYPLDVSAALRRSGPGHQTLLPTTVARKAVFELVGGFSTHRIFGLDVAFWLTASLYAKIVNVDDFLYLRRRRASSLTQRPDLGNYSAIRTIYRNLRRDDFKAIVAGRMRLEDSSLAVRHRASPVMFRNLRTGQTRQVTLDRRKTYGESP
jgi:hypothetical protein